jgi:TolB-like protein
MSKHEEVTGLPNADQVLAALDRIVASSVFRSSPQIASFLTFVVQAVLEGKSDRIKGYTIGIEVLRREATFDPQIDPIVRVEATRLRRALDRYYAGPGQADSVIISLPRGSYVPAFAYRTEILDDPDVAYFRWPVTRPVGKIAIAAAAVMAIGFLGWQSLRIGGAPERTGGIAPAGERILPGNGMPVLFVQVPIVVGKPRPGSVSADSLYVRIADAFSNFDLINVRRQSQEQARQPDRQSDEKSQINFRLASTVEYPEAGGARIRFELVDVDAGNLVWSRVFDQASNDENRSVEEDRIVRLLAETLAPPFGVIYSVGRGKSVSKGEIDPRYGCIIEAAESFRSFDPLQMQHARYCLERLTATYPNFGIGFTYRAALDIREYQYRFDERPDGPPAVDRALRAARRGVELNPESSRAYEMLFVSLFARHDLAAAFAAGDKALSLNRFDMRLLGSHGARLIASGEIDRGLAELSQAQANGRIIPGFEQFFLFLGNYLRGDMPNAAFHAGQLTGDNFQLAFIARCLIAQWRGDRRTAEQNVEQLVALNPAWRDDLRGSLKRFFEDPKIIDRLDRELSAAGLAPAAPSSPG